MAITGHCERQWWTELCAPRWAFILAFPSQLLRGFFPLLCQESAQSKTLNASRYLELLAELMRGCQGLPGVHDSSSSPHPELLPRWLSSEDFWEPSKTPEAATWGSRRSQSTLRSCLLPVSFHTVQSCASTTPLNLGVPHFWTWGGDLAFDGDALRLNMELVEG